MYMAIRPTFLVRSRLGALEEIFEPALNEAIKLNLLAELLMEVA